MWPAAWRLALAVAALAASSTGDRAAAFPALAVRGTGDELILEITHATRREALEALYGGGVILKWHDEAAANEVIRGRYRGSLDVIARRLLERCNYLAWYAGASGQPQITQIQVYASALRANGDGAQNVSEMTRRVPVAVRADELADGTDRSRSAGLKALSLPMRAAKAPPPPPGPDPRYKGLR